MTLADVITQVESAATDYNNAAATTQNDQATVANIQTKLDAANAQVVSDQATQNDKGIAFNTALDALIAQATASKVPVTPPPAPAQP